MLCRLIYFRHAENAATRRDLYTSTTSICEAAAIKPAKGSFTAVLAIALALAVLNYVVPAVVTVDHTLALAANVTLVGAAATLIGTDAAVAINAAGTFNAA